MNKNKVLVAAAAIVCLVIAAAVFMLRPEGHLVIRDAETGETYISYPLERGEEFSITFIHSVNKTPVTDVYDVDERGIIMLRKTIYYGFGAGVPSDLDPKMELTYEEGTGAMVVSKIDMELHSIRSHAIDWRRGDQSAGCVRTEYQGPHQLRKFAYLSIAFWKIKEAPSFTLCKNLVVISEREWKTQPSAAKERT